MPKMHQNAFGGPAGELMRSPDPLTQWGREGLGPTYKGMEGIGRGLLLRPKGDEREERGDGKRGEGNPPKVKVSRRVE